MVSPEENREAFAKRLKQAAADAGYPAYGTAARLARALGITPKAVGKWLNGEARPNAEKMESLARLLGV
ncbi:TPA: helix-turn-helix transcriptional regulator, partial [Pseudomonas aeruginosa]|nr:helix-turn-helix transcriptional regulator [Pseudomonas aeruginosa]